MPPCAGVLLPQGGSAHRDADAAVAAAMDMVVRDGDVDGSTVNIAARLTARAAPGEVLVSRPVADRIRQVGAVELKGVARPLEVWRFPAGSAPG